MLQLQLSSRLLLTPPQQGWGLFTTGQKSRLYTRKRVRGAVACSAVFDRIKAIIVLLLSILLGFPFPGHHLAKKNRLFSTSFFFWLAICRLLDEEEHTVNSNENLNPLYKNGLTFRGLSSLFSFIINIHYKMFYKTLFLF